MELNGDGLVTCWAPVEADMVLRQAHGYHVVLPAPSTLTPTLTLTLTLTPTLTSLPSHPPSPAPAPAQSATPRPSTPPRCDLVVLPEPGTLVAFESGSANLHAVERVTTGTRFALTMWFTRRKASPADATDPTHAAMLQWAASLPEDQPLIDVARPPTSAPHPPIDAPRPTPTAIEPPMNAPPLLSTNASTPSLPPTDLVLARVPAPPPPSPPKMPTVPRCPKLPSRHEAIVSAAICSLPVYQGPTPTPTLTFTAPK